MSQFNGSLNFYFGTAAADPIVDQKDAGALFKLLQADFMIHYFFEYFFHRYMFCALRQFAS